MKRNTWIALVASGVVAAGVLGSVLADLERG